MQCCADVQATYRKQQTPQLWMEGTGEGCRFFCSLKLPYFSWMSQQFCWRLSESQKWPYIPKKLIQLISSCWDVRPLVAFYLQFDFIIPILEQLECGDFVIFSALHLVSRLTCLDIMQCGALCTISYSLLYRKKKTKVKRIGNKAVIIVKIAV